MEGREEVGSDGGDGGERASKRKESAAFLKSGALLPLCGNPTQDKSLSSHAFHSFYIYIFSHFFFFFFF